MKNKKQNNIIHYLLVFILLLTSGNPAFYKIPVAKEAYILISILILLFYFPFLKRSFLSRFTIYISFFILIFIIQFINLEYLSIPFVIGFIIKAFIGCTILYIVGNHFSLIFFKVIYHLCLISLPFYLLHLVLGENALSDFYIFDSKSIGLYTFRLKAPSESLIRNSGMFWEPGAFQGYINLCLFLNLPNAMNIFKDSKYKLIVIIVALFTTQSTTGFLVFGLIILLYFLFYVNTRSFSSIFLLSFICILGVYIFNSFDFMGEKIETQYKEALEFASIGEYDPRRFGALLFDLHYIKKNPFTGNGFNAETRFSDHPTLQTLIEQGENIRHGNGFSNFVASAGILGILWYLYLVIYSPRKGDYLDTVLLAVIIVVLSQGEDYFRFPFVLGLPFLSSLSNTNNGQKALRLNHLLQPEKQNY